MQAGFVETGQMLFWYQSQRKVTEITCYLAGDCFTECSWKGCCKSHSGETAGSGGS